MNNKTLLLTLSFTLGTLFTNAQSLPGFQWGEGMGTPDLSWTAQVGAKTYPKGKIFQAADYGLKNDSTRLSTAALQKAIDECHRSGGGTVEVAPGYIIRKTKCFDFWERNVLFPKTKRSFFRTPTLPFSA